MYSLLQSRNDDGKASVFSDQKSSHWPVLLALVSSTLNPSHRHFSRFRAVTYKDFFLSTLFYFYTFIHIYFYLEGKCFIVSCWLLLYNVHQVISTHTASPSWIPLPPTPSHSSRLSMYHVELLCYTRTFH